VGSRNRRPARLVTILFAAALTAAACGGATTAVSPAGSPAANSTPLATGPLDRSNLAALVATTVPDPSQIGPLAEALSGAARTQVNAAAISASIPALQAIQDQDAMKALLQLQAKQAAAYSPSGLVQSAAWRPDVTRPLQHPSGALLATTETLVIAIVGGAVGAYDPRVDTSPQPLSQDFTDSSGGVDTSMRVTLTTSSGGGRFIAALAVDGDTTKTDPSSGAVVGRVVGSSNFVVSLNPCPDAGGLVSGHIAIEDDETDSGSAASGSTSVGFKYTGSGDFTTTVNDQAEIASTHFSAEVDRAVTSATQAAGSSEPGLTSTDLGLHFDQTVTGSAGGATDAQVTNAQGPVSAEDGRAVASAFTIGIEVPALALAAFASNVWKGGKCFEIRPSPDGGDVGPGSKTQIKVTVYHWVDKAEVKLPVKATLAGTKTVDPSGVDQTAPATFTFTAGQPDSTGDITYRVVSKRGIGERTSNFKVQSGLNVNISGTLVESVQPAGTYHLKITGTAIHITANPDNSLTVSGSVTVSGTVDMPLVGCTGTVNEHIDVIGQGMLTGPDDARVFHFQLGPASTNSLGGHVSCPYISMPFNAGDFFGQWSTTLGPVDLPATGGTVSKSGSTPGLLTRNATGTFVGKPN
jgi:hypothetical protein